MTPASKPSAAALRYAAPVSDALYAINERGLDCAPIRGEDPAPIDIDPDLLLLDEPFKGLSPLVIPHISSGLASICNAGKTVLMVESNARHVPHYVSRIAILERGEFIFVGALREAEQRPDLRQYIVGLA